MDKRVSLAAKILAVVGALNWGLVAVGPKFELVQYLQVAWLVRLVYALVGVAGVVLLVELVKKK